MSTLAVTPSSFSGLLSWSALFGTIDLVLATWATSHIVLNKRDHRAAIGWVGLVWLAPFVGAFAYFCLGINRIQRKALALRVRDAGNPPVDLQLNLDEIEWRDHFEAEMPNLVGLAMLGERITQRPVLPGNDIRPLLNGDGAYPEMLAAIDNAQRSVALLSYIFASDRAGQAFLEALVRARHRGVEVRVLVDDVGCRYSRRNMVRELRSAGVRAATFLPTRVPRMYKYANLRNHRKILVVDGRIGFTGGTNIREGHWMSLAPAYPVRCVHFRIEGPVVSQLQETFVVDWAFAAGEQLQGDAWFPEVARVGPVWARGIPDGPDEDFEKLTDAIQGALATSLKTVQIVTPYFLPETALIHALNVTAMRGVDVRIYVPEKNNIVLINWASGVVFSQILEKGCRVFLTPTPFDHTKLMIVDSVWSLIGSTNWDPRSLRLNFEFNVECYDEALATQLQELVQIKAKDAREIVLQEVVGRPYLIRLRDGLARLLTPYL